MGQETVDILWVVFGASLVFLMQAGFLCLETGLTRNKNNINVAVKNLADFALSTIIFFLAGYGLMFGTTLNGIVGYSDFIPSLTAIDTGAFFFFQVMFCGTAVTIMSGAVAERMRFSAYLLVTAVIAGAIYPLVGHWTWNGLNLGETTGWLAALGFVDFAGSTVVHSVGGWAALALLLILGPRTGIFREDGSYHKIIGSNLPLAALGTLLLFFGWFGFNGGSTLELNNTIVPVLVNTVLAGSAGLVVAPLLALYDSGRFETDMFINGALVGLVSVTANAHVVTSFQAILIGGLGSLVMFGADRLLKVNRIDDAVGAVPVHLAGGIWGTLAVGIFGDLALLGTGLSRFEQIGVQTLGIIAAGLLTFGISFFVFFFINRISTLRVSLEEERVGLNIAEHGARTDTVDLLNVIEEQAATGDLSLRVPVEPFTEIGRIAVRYNALIRRLQQSLQQSDAIIEKSMDGIITFSKADLAIKMLNPAAEKIFGHAQKDLANKSIRLLLRYVSGQEEQSLESILGIAAMSEKPLEIMGMRADGSYIPLEVNVAEAMLEDEPIYVSTLRDISIRKEADDALVRARDAALEADRFKSELLAQVSHELRTPLGVILGYTEMMQDGVYGPVTNEQFVKTEEIISSTRHLTDLVNELIDIAHLESGKIKLEKKEFSLSDMLQPLYAQLDVQASAKGLRLLFEVDPDTPQVVYSDEKRVRQIIHNLVANAIKFTESGYVSLRTYRDSSTTWAVQVKDTGIGIPAEHLSRIFDPFYQVDSSETKSVGGIGLGLAIVRQVCETLGGEVSVTSEVGQGTTFTATLPIAILEEMPV